MKKASVAIPTSPSEAAMSPETTAPQPSVAPLKVDQAPIVEPLPPAALLEAAPTPATAASPATSAAASSAATTPSGPHLKLWLLGLGLVGVIVLGLARLWFGPEVVAYPVVRGDLVKTIVASGNYQTPYRVDIAAQVTGTVADVLVDYGQTVKAGQPLIALDPTELLSDVAAAVGAVAQTAARLTQLRDLTLPQAQEALRQAEATLVDVNAAYGRDAQLTKSGYATKASLDDATKNLDVARAQVNSAELQVFTSKPGGSDYVTAQTQADQAAANLLTARTRLGYATIVAPRDGVLITRSVEKGTTVQPGIVLLVLAPAGESQVDVDIDEKNLGQLKLGQPAVASAVAYSDQKFAAVLSYINPSVDLTRASVEVKLTVTDPPAYLRQDMTVDVDIEVARRTATLMAPLNAVHDPNTKAPYILIIKDGRAINTPVQLGVRGTDQVEILQGVAAGDLIVPVAAGIAAGQHLRATKP